MKQNLNLFKRIWKFWVHTIENANCSEGVWWGVSIYETWQDSEAELKHF